MYKEYGSYRTFLIVSDMLLTLTVFALMVELRPVLPGRIIESAEVSRIPALYVCVALLWTAIFGFSGVYDLANIPSFLKQWGRFTLAYLLAVFVLGGVLYFTYRDMSRLLVAYFSVTNYFLLLFTRYVLTLHLKTALGKVKRTNVLMVGTTRAATDLAKTVMKDHTAIYNLVGFADNEWDYQTPLPAPLIGQLEEVPRLIDEYDINLVLIALPESRSRQTDQLINDLDRFPVRVYVVYDFGKLALLRSEVESFGYSLVVGVREPMIRGAQRLVKRIFDLTASLVLFILTLPVFILIWIAIRLDSPGPAIHRSERVGENGKMFQMLKFRSMVVGAAQFQDQSMTTDERGLPVYKLKSDPRVTRVGRFLRKTSLDELPQLINVIKGEMSLVGPRPEQPFVVENYDHWERERLSVPPGVTGWWQVSGRSDLPMHLNVHLDLYYVRNYSLFLDLRILFKTVFVVLTGKGAY